MPQSDRSAPWYHGSPHRLTTIRQGSWITPSKEIASAFSHRPTLISISDDHKTVKHNGTLPGFLYRVAEEIRPQDVTLLPGTDQTHWSTNRELSVTLVEQAPLLESEILTEEDIADLRRRHPQAGQNTFFHCPSSQDPPSPG